MRNYNITAKKQGGTLLFLRKIVAGAADDSYGIEVAKLAGVPDAIITKAKTYLRELESGAAQPAAPAHAAQDDAQMTLGDAAGDVIAEQLRAIDRQKAVQRKNRGKLTRVALVGYTNVGKSTLMNLLSKSDVFAENKLFATLDTTVRKVVIDNLPMLLTDTVGFIRKLPTHLVESFKSTLDEVREADLLIHVVDISHPNFEEQIKVVNETLNDICGGCEKPVIMVFNKIDAYTHVEKDADDLTPRTRENITLEELKESWMSRLGGDAVFISAKKELNIPELKDMIYEKAKEIHLTRFPYNDFLYQTYDDLGED